jgi:hypothetical protein
MRVTLWVIALTLAVAACQSIGRGVRKVTYPPDFNYITREQLDDAMWQLAKSVNDLNRAMRQPGPIDARRREAIIGALSGMEMTAGQVKGKPGWHSNHPVIDAKLERFQRDIVAARRAVEAEPPNYFLAGSASGACLYCHDTHP